MNEAALNIACLIVGMVMGSVATTLKFSTRVALLEQSYESMIAKINGVQHTVESIQRALMRAPVLPLSTNHG